jgi:large subunit ribosomal protein L30
MAVKETKAKKASAAKAPEGQLKIQLVRSVIGRPQKQREVVKGLGLRRINSEVIRKDCPEIRGMINKIPHLVSVEELE